LANYTFDYIEGTSRPSSAVAADSDEEAYGKIGEFLAQKPGRSLVSGSIRMTESRRVPDPPK
jgi:hypothetical protein